MDELKPCDRPYHGPRRADGTFWRTLDLFAGPGGWDVAARGLGLDPLGIEWDDAACATRKAAGLRTYQADVAALSPNGFTAYRGGGLIGSPPCQAYSMAGKGAGRRDVEHVIACAMELAAGNDSRAAHSEACEDKRSLLVVEPLRFALALRPRWIALEQVPPVLELWSLFAHLLSEHGYSTWTGVLEAERYGVPQTRERAVLMARLDGPVEPPRATHQRYVPGEPQRHDLTMDGEVLPWVSMAEALGWRDAGGLADWALADAHSRDHEAARVLTDPAPTLRGSSAAGSQRVWRRLVPDASPLQFGGDEWPADKGVRVTIQEAAALQSFPPDYPWQGSRTKQFQQVGNAVPPGLAGPVLRAVCFGQ